ncbi:hypothetical protein SMD44_03482 [Streptomyces alboflavus]|uniref:Uncharacterized protein n=1 Tax=Streptomyces alboflavus TaxID=67267 RepID=A0A1Z1WC91_9ACTN|nr:hypothetical protein SMD44_03482 [Streptomyces alboflavus]
MQVSSPQRARDSVPRSRPPSDSITYRAESHDAQTPAARMRAATIPAAPRSTYAGMAAILGEGGTLRQQATA